ncbi:MAG: hypothetical protein GOU97_01810 [Nanoarchaeota archaeon]|nr:hypothetical protein [Nanoarchaeota archaeon]
MVVKLDENLYFRELRNIESWRQVSNPVFPQRFYLGWAYLINRALMRGWAESEVGLDGLCDKVLGMDVSLEQGFVFDDNDYHYDEVSWNAITPSKVFDFHEKLVNTERCFDYVVPLGRGATPAGVLLAQLLSCGLKPLLFSVKKLKMDTPFPKRLDLGGRVLLLNEDSFTYESLGKAKGFVSGDEVLTGSIVYHEFSRRPDIAGEALDEGDLRVLTQRQKGWF